MKYLYSCLLILAMILTVSCTEQKDENQTAFEFTAYLDTIIQDWEGQDEFIQEYYKLTGINLKIVQPPHQQYMEKLMVSFTESDSPEVCEVLPEYISLMVSKEIPLALDEFIESSNYMKDFPDTLLDSLRARDGKIYGFPTRDGGGCVTYIRKDWLDNLGLDIPRTWDDFYQVLYAFTHNDPDGNGIDDTRGYTDVSSGAEDWYNRAVMLDARVEIYYRDGEWVDGFTEDAMIPALERLRKIYQEGLTDSNIPTNTTFTARNRFFSGDVGVITYWGNHWARNILERTRAVTGPHVEIVAIPPLEDGYYIKRSAPLLLINRSADDSQRIFTHFIDRQYDKGEIQSLFTYGVQGYHWDYVDGELRFLTNKNDPYKASFTKAFVPPIAVINDWEQPMPRDEIIDPVLTLLNENSRQQRLKFGEEYFSKYYLEIERVLKPEIISRIILGELEIEEGLALYRKRAEELYLNRILAELN
ncbi:MAG: extracellular solute-binding protein [Spirochaetales bacterium]|nr:extracellular solute-binding protein [Spirochaetales bacterium]